MNVGEVSVWIAALSALGTLGLGAAIGAYVGAVVAHRLREKAEQERAERERNGLLRLVSVEIMLQNAIGLRDHVSRPSNQYTTDNALVNNPGRPLQTDSWQQVRTRIVQLLPPGRYTILAEYYANVQWFNQLLDQHTPPKDRLDIPSVARGFRNWGRVLGSGLGTSTLVRYLPSPQFPRMTKPGSPTPSLRRAASCISIHAVDNPEQAPLSPGPIGHVA